MTGDKKCVKILMVKFERSLRQRQCFEQPEAGWTNSWTHDFILRAGVEHGELVRRRAGAAVVGKPLTCNGSRAGSGRAVQHQRHTAVTRRGRQHDVCVQKGTICSRSVKKGLSPSL